MSAAVRLVMVREIEKAGGAISCWIDDGEHVVTVRLADGRSIEARNAAAYDFSEALIRFTVARLTPPQVEVHVARPTTPARTRKKRNALAPDPPRKAKAAVVDQAPATERLSLRDRLKQRNSTA